jgi:hypothetical protein
MYTTDDLVRKANEARLTESEQLHVLVLAVATLVDKSERIANALELIIDGERAIGVRDVTSRSPYRV